MGRGLSLYSALVPSGVPTGFCWTTPTPPTHSYSRYSTHTHPHTPQGSSIVMISMMIALGLLMEGERWRVVPNHEQGPPQTQLLSHEGVTLTQ